MLNPDGTRCEGCVYIYPLGRWLTHGEFERHGNGEQFADDTPPVTFWVRDSALARGLDQQLLSGLREWFRQEWPHETIAFPIPDTLLDDISLVETAGLALRATHRSVTTPGFTCRVYTEPD